MHSIRTRRVHAMLPALAASIIGCGGEQGPTQPAGPTNLAFVVQPSTVTSGAVISPAVQVTVQDAQANTVTNSTASVTLAIVGGTGGAVLGGTLTRAVVSGVATFNDLTIDKGGSGYTLAASAPGLTGATSAPFAVTLTFAAVSAGNLHTCGLTTEGAAYCWGMNTLGELGDGTATQRTSPVAVLGGFTFATVSAGGHDTCGLTTGGAAYCWGFNYIGQLGDGTTTDRMSPVPVLGGLTFAAVGVSGAHTCGVTTGGAAYCWGYNADGQLGDGTITDRPTPVPVVGGRIFATLSAWYGPHTCGVTTGGAGYCWGRNVEGQLGDGGMLPLQASPVAVVGGLTFAAVSVGSFYTCGVTTGGSAYCWGANRAGQLGDGDSTDRKSPVAVLGGHTFAAVSAGYAHTCGVTTGGAVYCWGANDNGQLGDGTTTARPSPVAVVGGHTFAAVSTGGAHTCGVTAGAAAYCWGDNSGGQLGDGTTGSSLVPVRVVQ